MVALEVLQALSMGWCTFLGPSNYHSLFRIPINVCCVKVTNAHVLLAGGFGSLMSSATVRCHLKRHVSTTTNTGILITLRTAFCGELHWWISILA